MVEVEALANRFGAHHTQSLQRTAVTSRQREALVSMKRIVATPAGAVTSFILGFLGQVAATPLEPIELC